ncbi:MAG: hypothetical protein AAF682_19700 [Planctomycetota bacterium]
MQKVSAPGASPEGYFQSGDTETGQAATEISADDLTALWKEIVNLVEQSGQVLDPTSFTQVLQAVQRLSPIWRNALINAQLVIAQRGVGPFTFDSSNHEGYSFDRWRAGVDSGAGTDQLLVQREDFTPGQADVPGNPRHYLRLNATTTPSGRFFLEQRIEGVRTFAGETVVQSAWWRSSGLADETVHPKLVQHFGSGGAPSPDVVTDMPQLTALQDDWARLHSIVTAPSIAGKTIGNNGDDYLALRWEFDGAAAAKTLDVALPQIEPGENPSSFEARQLSVELLAAMRYFERSWASDNTIGNTGTDGAARAYDGDTGDMIARGLSTRFRVEKRMVPTVTWYSASGGTSGRIDWGGLERVVSSTNGNSEQGTGAPLTTTAPASAGAAEAHWTADAEL